VPVEGALTVVGAVDADGLEARRHGVDLAEEVLRGEPPSPSAFGGVFDVAASRVPVGTSSPAAASSPSCRPGRRARTRRCTAGPRRGRARPSSGTRVLRPTRCTR
jgi:hypothetical protein